MFTFHDERYLEFTPKQLYTLVLDIPNYPKFLPWCAGARIVEDKDNMLIADLIIEFKIFTESYRSHITHSKINENDYSIIVEAVSGPFKYLKNHWQFIEVTDDSANIKTKVMFDINFAFKSNVLGLIASNIFGKATKKMIHAFEQRAKEIYV